MATDGARDLKTLLDQLAEQAGSGAEPTADTQILRTQAIGDFIAGGPALLDEATPFLWEYYRHTAAEFTPAERAQYGYRRSLSQPTSGSTSSSGIPPSGARAAARWSRGAATSRSR